MINILSIKMIIIRKLRTNNALTMVNKFLCVVNAILTLFSSVMVLMSFQQVCVVLFWLYYILIFSCQTITYYLCVKLPKMNVQAYNLMLRKIIALIGLVETSYLFASILFWGKSSLHPGYCALCVYYGLSITIGIAIDIHWFMTFMSFINLLHGFVTRRYYLLALGGYEVEQRRLQQIQEINNRQQMLEPYYNDYPLPINSQVPKYCKFEDLDDSIQIPQSFVCSICLNSKLTVIEQEVEQEITKKQEPQIPQTFEDQTSRKVKLENQIQLEKRQNNNKSGQKNQMSQEGYQIVYTPCKHFFHKSCIQNWAKVNPNCPDCRSKLLIVTE